eukprot:6115773-Pyramimonas_sp.AAC.1
MGSGNAEDINGDATVPLSCDVLLCAVPRRTMTCQGTGHRTCQWTCQGTRRAMRAAMLNISMIMDRAK